MNLLEVMGPHVPLLPLPTHMAEDSMITQDVLNHIKSLKAIGWGARRIGRELNLDKKTVRKYLRMPAIVPYQRPKPVRRSLFDLEPWLSARASEVGFNASVLFREAREKGFTGCYETIKRFVRPLRQQMTLAAEATMRFETAPGQQGQVDWGSALVFVGEKRVRVHFFAMVLGFSRRMYARGYPGERRSFLLDGHQRAFEWFGGYPKELLYDNARTMIMTERSQEERLNKVFKDFADHYGFEPRFCRPYRPRTKGKVESGVKYLKHNFLAGRRFRDLEHLNAELEHWLTHVADTRIHGTTHEVPAVRFEQERSALNPIASVRPWQPDLGHQRKVANDGHVDLATNRYPVPLEAVGRRVNVCVDQDEVVIRQGIQELARHARLPGRFQKAPCPPEFQKYPQAPGIAPSDQPPRHDPRWPVDEVQIRDLKQYDVFADAQEVT